MGREESFVWARDTARPTDTAASFAHAARFVPQLGIAAYGVATILYLLARLLVGEQWRAVAWMNNFVPWLGFGALALAVVALFFHSRWLLLALQAPIVVVFVLSYADQLLPHDPAVANGPATEVRAATYNMHARRSDPAEVTALVTSLDADIIGMVEVRSLHAAQIVEATQDEYPYQIWHPLPNVHGLGFISRYPILEEEVFLPVDDSNLHLRVVLDVDGTPVTVYIAHPPSPEGPFSPLHYDDGPRNVELAIVRERVAAASGPVLVLCDCNMSDQSDPYRAMDALLDDAFRTAGQGFGFTFPFHRTFLPPLVRIDYVWHSDHFTALDAYPVGNGGTSDHRPVVARLALETGQP